MEFHCYQVNDHIAPIEVEAPSPGAAAILAATRTQTPGRWLVLAGPQPADYQLAEIRSYSITDPDEAPF